tara:strand:+ start:205 stop:405 length:201 start_codon:yes stop_codon:yes gene_type:complete
MVLAEGGDANEKCQHAARQISGLIGWNHSIAASGWAMVRFRVPVAALSLTGCTVTNAVFYNGDSRA